MISASVAHTAPAEAGGDSHSLLTENVYDARGRLTLSTRNLDGGSFSYYAQGPCLADTRKGLQFSYNVA